jgi:hypothetical protein
LALIVQLAGRPAAERARALTHLGRRLGLAVEVEESVSADESE